MTRKVPADITPEQTAEVKRLTAEVFTALNSKGVVRIDFIIDNADGKVYVNGEELQEDYLQPNVVTTSLNGQFTDLIVPKGYVYVLGDNREDSEDSRDFGLISKDEIKGVAFFNIWPLSRFGKV